jgi:uracil-DNA glycosylase family 4
VNDSFQQALGETLSILNRIKEGFGPYPTVSLPALESLKIAFTRQASTAEIAADEPSGDSRHESTFAALREAALVCLRCPHLVRTRTQVVFGVGNPNAELMFVGEAPGADEDAQGEPFVGRAGQLLTKIIEAMGFRREEVYIANVLKCRPDMPAGVSGNRKPTAEEMKTCLPWLEKQIELIKPRAMVALGATALEGLLGATTAVSKVRGRWLDFHGTPVMATYHPAYLLRNQSVTEKRKVWEDMLQVLERLGKPISERQRRFFTKTES